jgi:CRISPR-associated protein Cas5d
MPPRDQVLDVWGEFACFTRPELKVERFSYPVPTPSAVRGIYDAIYCNRHEFRWQVTKVEILNPVKYIALRRNEVREKVNAEDVEKKWMTGKPPTPIFADLTEKELGTDCKGRVQRQTMALRDVRYRFTAVIRPYDGYEGRLAGYENEFRRRADKGKCIYQPYFGCREFPAYFELVSVPAAPVKPEKPFDLDVGWMLYDVFDLTVPVPNELVGQTRPRISLFHVSGEHGVKASVLTVPPYEDALVHKVPKEDNHA